jgi:hypothetical protein
MYRDRHDSHRTPTAFKIWFGSIAVLGAGMLGLAAWAVVSFVTWVTK